MLTRRAVQATCLALMLMMARVPSISAAEPVSDYTAIDRYVQSQVDANHFPGLALAVVEGASLAHALGFGHDAQGQVVTAQTPFIMRYLQELWIGPGVITRRSAGLRAR